MGKRKETTIFAFRHMGSVGTNARTVLHEGEDFHPIKPYQQLIDAVADARRQGSDFDVEVFKQRVDEPLHSEPITSFLTAYKALGPDAKFDILPCEHERAKRIGESLQDGGESIDRLESSPLVRAFESAKVVRSGLSNLQQPIYFNNLAKERRWGQEIEEVANETFYFALHPDELKKSIREGDKYRGGGKDAESNVQFRSRIGDFVGELQHKRRFGGKNYCYFWPQRAMA